MPLAWQGDGGQVGKKLLLNRSKPLRGLLKSERQAQWLLPSFRYNSEGSAGSRVPGTDGCCSAAQQVPGSRQQLCTLFALVEQHRAKISALSPTWGLCDQCEILSFPILPASPPVSAISSSENSHIIDFKQSEISAG